MEITIELTDEEVKNLGLARVDLMSIRLQNTTTQFGLGYAVSLMDKIKKAFKPKYAIKFFVETYSDRQVMEYFEPSESFPVGLLARAHDYGFAIVELNYENEIIRRVHTWLTYVQAEDHLNELQNER